MRGGTAFTLCSGTGTAVSKRRVSYIWVTGPLFTKTTATWEAGRPGSQKGFRDLFGTR